MDFKIGDSFEDETQIKNRKRKNKILPYIIVGVLAIIIGLGTFLLLKLVFKEKKVEETTEPISQEISIEEDNVKLLYRYITFGNTDKFIKEENVDINSFTNKEKFFYAMQYTTPEELTNSNKKDESNRTIFILKNEIVKEHMERFFGSDVKYVQADVTCPFNFEIDYMNIGQLKYDLINDEYQVVFTGKEEKEEKIVPDFDKKLVKAIKDADNTLHLQEKIIYTKVEENNGVYTIYIYKDYQNKELIDTKENQTKEDMNNNPITVENYLDKASTITYNFKVDNKKYYFDSSLIS